MIVLLKARSDLTVDRNSSKNEDVSSNSLPAKNFVPDSVLNNERPTENIVAPTKKTLVSLHSSIYSLSATKNENEKTVPDENVTDTVKFSTLPLFQGARQMIHSLSHSRKKAKDGMEGQTDTTLVPLPILSNSRRFGPYEIVAEIARKPLGNSYKARHVDQDRMYFLKILTSDLIQSQQFEDRIKRTRRLVHPRIVNYTDYGNLEGFFYIAAEFVEGETLQTKMEKFLSLRESLEFSHQILTILEYAHRQEIYHGALSPTNIFILPDGTVKITDFALPTLLNQSLSAFSPESLGYHSLYYTEPSCIKSPLGLNFTSDIYAVGAILYKFVTDKTLFTGETFGALLENIENATPLYSFESDVPVGVRAVIRKATQLHREKRYPNIRMFAQDVENFLHFRPIISAKPFLLERWFATHSHSSRFRWALGFSSVTFFLLFMSLIWRSSLLQEKNIQIEKLQALQKEYYAFQAESFLEKATHLQASHPEIAGLFVANSYQKLPSKEAQSLLSSIYLQSNSVFKKYLPEFVPSSYIGPSTEPECFLTVDAFKGIQEWNSSSGNWIRVLRPISPSFPYQEGPFTPYSHFFYVGIGPNVFEYQRNEEKYQKTFSHTESVSSLFVTPEMLFTGTAKGVLSGWDRQSGTQIFQQILGEDPIRTMAFEKNSKTLFVAFQNRIFAYSLKNKTLFPLFDFSPHRGAITQLKIQEPFPFLFSSGLDHRIHAVDLKTGKLVYSFIGHQSGVVDFCWSEDASFLYSLAENGEVFQWLLKPSIAANAPQETFHFRSTKFQKIYRLSKTRLALLTEGTLHFLETSPFRRVLSPHYAFNPCSELSFFAPFQGKKIYTHDPSGKMIEWDMASQKPLRLFLGVDKEITAIALNTSLPFLWAGDTTGALFEWSLSEEHPKINWKAHASAVQAIVADQHFVYSASAENLICFEVSHSPRILWKAPAAISLVLNATKDKLWASSIEGVLRCYDTQKGTELAHWKMGTLPLSLQFSPVSVEELILSMGNTFIVWDTQKERIQEQYELEEALIAGTLSESFVFLSTKQYFFVFRRGEKKAFLTFSSPDICRQLTYLPKKQSILCSFSKKGLGEWPHPFFTSTEWLSPLYWETQTKGQLSGLKFVPFSSSKPQK